MWAFSIICVVIVVSANAILETNHLVQIDNNGRKVAMDVTYDSDKNTVHVVIGDVSMYKEGIQTVNLHDYNSGYGVLKSVNDRICLLGRVPFPKATPEKYRVGLTHEVHDHMLDINSTRLTHDDISKTAGPNIATFCNTYSTYHVTATPVENSAKVIRDTADTQKTTWCVLSGCSTDDKQYQELLTRN